MTYNLLIQKRFFIWYPAFSKLSLRFSLTEGGFSEFVRITRPNARLTPPVRGAYWNTSGTKTSPWELRPKKSRFCGHLSFPGRRVDGSCLWATAQPMRRSRAGWPQGLCTRCLPSSLGMRERLAALRSGSRCGPQAQNRCSGSGRIFQRSKQATSSLAAFSSWTSIPPAYCSFVPRMPKMRCGRQAKGSPAQASARSFSRPTANRSSSIFR